jgi:mevalonate pyrophosphate decarboxylase
MDSRDQITEAPSTSAKSVTSTVTYTTVRTVEVKYITEVVDTTYADGSTKQDRHDRSEVHVTVDRDDFTDAPQGEV